MATLKNINPLGDIDLPIINRQGENCLRAGEEFEVSDEIASDLLQQAGNFEAVTSTTTTKPASGATVQEN